MYSGNGWGNRGEHIIPSARKSIHSHTRCPFAASKSTMGRYGINGRDVQKNENPTPPIELGQDVVDNALSKHAYKLSEEQFKQRNSERRHSSNYDNCDISDDNCKIISKSLQEIFASNLHCSDDSQTEENYSPNLSEQSHYQSPESSNYINNSSNHNSLHEYNNRDEAQFSGQVIFQNQKGKNWTRDDQTNNTNYLRLCTVLILIICILIMCGLGDWYPVMQDKGVSTSAEKYNKLKFYNDMSAIGKIYHLNEDSVLQLQVGIASISEKQDTDSFIFVYNSENENFNFTALNEFINEIASVSARYLRKENASVRHIVVDTSSLMVKDTDELIHKYSDDITNGGVMVMRKLDMLPSSLAMALHYYCDVYNPLVKKSAMFFTLDIANCSGKMSTHSDIEECLEGKWSTVSSEFIGPLLSRVVSVVVDVTNLF